MNDTLTAVPGFRVGHWSDVEGATGCTVILCPPEGAVAAVDVRGGSPGTRETDLLRPENTVERVHAVVLAGGSAFGLAAADGVMRWLWERNVGFDTSFARVPIVPSAILFDLPVGRADAWPGPEAGYAACEAAHAGPVEQGNVGAGVGASVGKGRGMAWACKAGVGSAAAHLPNGLVVAALAIVNAFGAVSDPHTGRVLAGVRQHDAEGRFIGFVDAVELLKAGEAPHFAGPNTTLAVVATNGRLSKAAMAKVAQQAQAGLARTIRPVFSTIDGDVIFALSYGEVKTHTDMVGMVAADVLAQAVVNGVVRAASCYGLPAANDFLGASAV
ncbi:MAG: P1 family peptidase [Caldilinea sp.]|nr:P1 family peptidase [Caldilinea sp.]MDW8441227.1 P1 family peptidase [Caldilineaceae bacterium]